MTIPTNIVGLMSPPEIQMLQDISINKLCLELGAYQGFSTVSMALVANLVMSIDTHGGDEAVGNESSFAPYFNNIYRYGVLDRVAILVGRTEDVTPRLKGLQFDVIFIDATHSYVAAKRDTENCIPLLAPGGLMAWHDYERELIDPAEKLRCEVTRVVDELIKSGSFEKIDQADTLVVCKRQYDSD